MTGRLGTSATPLAEVNLVLQLIILAVLLLGFVAAKRKHFKRHGHIMAVAVALNGILIFSVMAVSLIVNFSALYTGPVVGSAIILSHAAIGGVAWTLGLIFIFKKFGNVRMWMRIVFGAWILALALGIGFYVFYYV